MFWRRCLGCVLLSLLSQVGPVGAGPALRPPECGGLDWLLARWRSLAGSPVDPSAAFGSDPSAGAAAWLPGRFGLHVGGRGRLRAGRAERAYADVMPFAPPATTGAALRWRVHADAAARLGEFFYLEQSTWIDSAPELDPAARTKQYRQIEASVETPRAVIGYRRGPVELRLGRVRESWGPGWTGSLLLSAIAAPADGLDASIRGARWRARARFGKLDSREVEGRPHSRWLAAHRFEWRAHPRWRLAWSEAALVATTDGLPLWLANPALPWALTQQEDRSGTEIANVLWAIDIVWQPGRCCSVYGQFLLDDFMLDGADREQHPDQLGGLLGCLWTRPTDSGSIWTLGAEATRLGNWTYVHRDPLVRYRSWGASLGHPAGPGSEAITAFVAHRRRGRGSTALLWARWHRRGRVWIGTEESPDAAPSLAFPAPPRARFLQLGTLWRPAARAGWRATLRLGWTGLRRDAGVPDPLDPVLSDPARGWWGSLELELPLLEWSGS